MALVGCSSSHTMNHDDMIKGEKITKAKAVIFATKGNTVSGWVTFTQVDGGIQVSAEISGLTPHSKHGFHIHQYGDLSSTDGTAMAGHFNPMNMEHSSMDNSVRHVGDLGNITADADGKAVVNFVDHVISFYGTNSIIGRGVIVHAQEDDYKTQPTGNAGGRIGQAVIGVVKP